MSTFTAATTADMLNDLIRITSDRIHWYEKALSELGQQDRDMEGVFEANLQKSHMHFAILTDEVRDLEAEVNAGETRGGEIYQAWAETTDPIIGTSRHDLLLRAQASESAAQTAYLAVLDNPQLPGYLLELLVDQNDDLRKMERRIHSLKDSVF